MDQLSRNVGDDGRQVAGEAAKKSAARRYDARVKDHDELDLSPAGLHLPGQLERGLAAEGVADQNPGALWHGVEESVHEPASDIGQRLASVPVRLVTREHDPIDL